MECRVLWVCLALLDHLVYLERMEIRSKKQPSHQHILFASFCVMKSRLLMWFVSGLCFKLDFAVTCLSLQGEVGEHGQKGTKGTKGEHVSDADMFVCKTT